MKYIIALMAVIAWSSCKKDVFKKMEISSVIVVNAVQDGGAVKMNSNVNDSVKAYNSFVFGIPPTLDTVMLIPTTSSALYFKGHLPLTAGGIYSLYLSGAKSRPDTLLVKENIPAFYKDSTMGIRLVNLCSGSGPLHLTVESDPTTDLFADVSYRNVTGFIKRALPKVVPPATVTFQVRNSANQVITSYVLPQYPDATYLNIAVTSSINRNITLVVKGVIGGTGNDAPGLFPVANY